MVFVALGVGGGRGGGGGGGGRWREDEVDGCDEEERDDAGVEDVVRYGDALVLGVREGEGEVGRGEESVEGGGEGDDEGVGCCEDGEAKVVWGVGALEEGC